MIIFTEVNINYRRLYYIDGERFITTFDNHEYFILLCDYNYYEYRQFNSYSIVYIYKYNRLFLIRYLNYSEVLHREDGPYYIQYFVSGEIHKKLYFLNNKEYCYEDYVLEIEKLV